MIKTLADLEIGEISELNGFHAISNELKHKFLALGLLKGTEVKVMNIAPLGDPIEISVRGYLLSLRKEEAKHLKVKEIENES